MLEDVGEHLLRLFHGADEGKFFFVEADFRNWQSRAWPRLVARMPVLSER